MDYIRQLTSSANLKANSSRGESPISDIVETAEEAQINIDSAVQAVLHAAEVARHDDADDTDVDAMETKDTTSSHVGGATQVDVQPVRFEQDPTPACDAGQAGLTEEQAAQALRSLYDAAEQHDGQVETQASPTGQIRFADQASPAGNVRTADAMDESMPLSNQPEPVDVKPNQHEATQEPTIGLNIRDANGYSTIFRCKPSSKSPSPSLPLTAGTDSYRGWIVAKLSKVFKVFAKRYQTELSKIRFISSDGRLLPKCNPNLTVQSKSASNPTLPRSMY